MTYKILVGNNLEILPTLPDNSVDSIVTDPPYGLSDNKFVVETITRWVNGERDFVPDGKGFMGKSWDAFVPPPALWDECFRILKPGGHLLAFFGSRTQDIGGLAIRMVGFEIRDSIGWVYGSGFPKSLDVSKAIDKRGGVTTSFTEFRDTVKSAMTQNKVSSKQLREALGNHMISHYLTAGSQPAIPNWKDYQIIRDTVGLGDTFDELFSPEAEREVIGSKMSGIANKDEKQRHTIGASKAIEVDITAPTTPEAKQWQGWGTALKPALEPIVVARKPLIGTVAENVLTYGTGGLNIDASRIGSDITKDPNYRPNAKNHSGHGSSFSVGGENTRDKKDLPDAGFHNSQGRWPANLILDEYTAELLDKQSGQGKSGKSGIRTADGFNANAYGAGMGIKAGQPNGEYGDSGGASRFFYVAKASKRDRNEGLEDLDFTSAASMVEREPDSAGMNSPRAGAGRTSGAKNFHPTVKPTALMEYLIKLVTPPGGTVLDPFTGSGSTGKAAVLNGFDFIGIEMTEDYVPIIEGRLRHAEKVFAENETEKLF